MIPASTASRLPTEKRQAEVVAAALRLVQDRSPATITTTDLARALGLSQGALFKHFATKEAVWLAVMVWVAAHLLPSLADAAAQAETPVKALRRVFDAHIQFIVTYPGVPRLIFNELQKPEETPVKQQVRSLMTHYMHLLRRLLDESVKRGDLVSGLDVSAAATLFLGIVQGLVMQSMLSGQIATMQLQAPAAFKLYLNGLLRTP